MKRRWSLETFLIGQIRAYNHYTRKNKNLFYYALPSALDVDLIVELKKPTLGQEAEIIGMEFKPSIRWRREWEGPLRDLASDKGIKMHDFVVLPMPEFLKSLFSGEKF